MGTGAFTETHDPFLVEWLSLNFPPGSWRTNVRVGVVIPELRERAVTPQELRTLELWTRRIDAIVFLPNKVIIVEAMSTDRGGYVEKLKIDKMLFLADPKFQAYHKLPIELILLAKVENPFYRRFASTEGVRYEVFTTPEWEREKMRRPPRERRGRLASVVYPEEVATMVPPFPSLPRW